MELLKKSRKTLDQTVIVGAIDSIKQERAEKIRKEQERIAALKVQQEAERKKREETATAAAAVAAAKAAKAAAAAREKGDEVPEEGGEE